MVKDLIIIIPKDEFNPKYRRSSILDYISEFNMTYLDETYLRLTREFYLSDEKYDDLLVIRLRYNNDKFRIFRIRTITDKDKDLIHKLYIDLDYSIFSLPNHLPHF